MSRYPSGATSCVVADAGFFSSRFRFLLDPRDSQVPGETAVPDDRSQTPHEEKRHAPQICTHTQQAQTKKSKNTTPTYAKSSPVLVLSNEAPAGKSIADCSGGRLHHDAFTNDHRTRAWRSGHRKSQDAHRHTRDN